MRESARETNRYGTKNKTYGIVECNSQAFQYARLLVRMQNQRCVHNARRSVARKRVVYIREWSGGRGCDALTAAVTPHVDTSSVADGDAYVIVMQGGNVGHSSHFMLDLMVQLLIMKSCAFFFFHSLLHL